MRKLPIVSLSVLSLVTTSCASDGKLTNGGKVAIGCIGAGAIVYLITKDAKRALAGCAVGAIATAIALNEAEKKKQEEAEERALESGQRVDWQATEDLPGADTTQSAPPPPAQAVAVTTRTYSERNPHYCKIHLTICRRKDEDERRGPHHARTPEPVAIRPAPKPQPRQVVTAAGYVIPISTKTNGQGQTCRELQEHGEKNGKKADVMVTKCKTSSGWVVEA